MERVTKKTKTGYEVKTGICNMIWADRKLGQLEDWEDLYDIELLTLLKAEKVYWRNKWVFSQGYSNVKESYKCYIDLHNHQLIVYDDWDDEFGTPLPFEEYGKTWVIEEDKHLLSK